MTRDLIRGGRKCLNCGRWVLEAEVGDWCPACIRAYYKGVEKGREIAFDGEVAHRRGYPEPIVRGSRGALAPVGS